MRRKTLSNPPKGREVLFCLKYGLVGGTGEADYLADGASNLLAAADDFFLFLSFALEEFSDVGEGVVLLEEGKETRVGYSGLPW